MASSIRRPISSYEASSSSSKSNSFLGYLIEWRNSFRIYKGVVIEQEGSQCVTAWELTDHELVVLDTGITRITKIKPDLYAYANHFVYEKDFDSNRDRNAVMLQALDRLDDSDPLIRIARARLTDLFTESDSDVDSDNVVAQENPSSPQIQINDKDIPWTVKTSIETLNISNNEVHSGRKSGLVSQFLKTSQGMNVKDSTLSSTNTSKRTNDNNDDSDSENGDDSDNNSDSENDSDDSSDSSDDDMDSDSDSTRDRKPKLIGVKVSVLPTSSTRGFSLSLKKGTKPILKQLSADYEINIKLIKLHYVDEDGDKIDVIAKSDFEFVMKSHGSSANSHKPVKLFADWKKPALATTPEKLRETQSDSRSQKIEESNQCEILVDVKSKPSPRVRVQEPDQSQSSKVINIQGQDKIEGTSSPIKRSNTSKSVLTWQRGEMIGAGSFGRVYNALDLVTGNKIAVKEFFLRKDKKSRLQAESVAREVKLLSTLDHANIVKYIGTEYLDDNIRIFLELATEGSIKDMLNEFGPLSEPLIKRFSRDILNGLSFIHSKNIIHRDIKPSNLLVINSSIKLADFGCASIMSSNLSGNHTVAGTTIYMSPEILQSGYDSQDDGINNGNGGSQMGRVRSSRGSRHDAQQQQSQQQQQQQSQLPLPLPPPPPQSQPPNNSDTESMNPKKSGYGLSTDIWSLGVSFVEMSLGRPPFPTAASYIYSVMVKADFPKLRDSASSDAKRFVDCCLQREPLRRGTADELLHEPFIIRDVEPTLPSLIANINLNESVIEKSFKGISDVTGLRTSLDITPRGENIANHIRSVSDSNSMKDLFEFNRGNNSKKTANLRGSDEFDSTCITNDMRRSVSSGVDPSRDDDNGYFRRADRTEVEEVTYSNLSNYFDFGNNSSRKFSSSYDLQSTQYSNSDVSSQHFDKSKGTYKSVGFLDKSDYYTSTCNSNSTVRQSRTPQGDCDDNNSNPYGDEIEELSEHRRRLNKTEKLGNKMESSFDTEIHTGPKKYSTTTF